MISVWKERLEKYFCEEGDLSDGAHDLAHFRRVAWTAQKIAQREEALVDTIVLLAAGYLHDLVSLPKNDPQRHLSSLYSAERAAELLTSMEFPTEKIEGVCHAIHTHSFSANVAPKTIEAKIVQDADRLEALGALGILRTFYINGVLGSKSYHAEDLFAKNRVLDDKLYAVDHFFCKLFKLADLFCTKSGRQIAVERSQFLTQYLNELEGDLEKKDGGALFILNSCYRSGKHAGKLFDGADPFGDRRKLDLKKYVLDELLVNRQNYPFIETFIAQLREEIMDC